MMPTIRPGLGAAALAVLIPVVTGVSAVGFGCSSSIRAIPASGALGRGLVESRVDAEIARYYLEEFLPGRGSHERWDEQLNEWRSLSPSELVERSTMAEIAARSGSVDLAALVFAAAVSGSKFQERFEQQLRDPRVEDDDTGSSYLIVFVPGWLYQSHPGTGADFATSRSLLTRLGIEHVLVPTLENASIETNAGILEEALIGLNGGEREVIVVSTSKGGPEVAMALDSMGEKASRVAAWINIGGLLHGSRLADEALEAPRRWGVDLLLWWKRWNPAGLRSLTTRAAERRWRPQPSLPSELLVVNLVAVPLSGDVSPRARDGYRSLRKLGPNDGLTLLADAIWPGGETLVVLGTDHFFSGVEIDRLTAAVLRTVERTLAKLEDGRSSDLSGRVADRPIRGASAEPPGGRS